MNRHKTKTIGLVITIVAGTAAVAAWARPSEPETTVVPRITYAKDLKKQKEPRGPWLSQRPSRGPAGANLDWYEAMSVGSYILDNWDDHPQRLRYLLSKVPKRPFLDRKWFYSFETPRRHDGVWSMRGVVWTKGALLQPMTIEVAGERGTLTATITRKPAVEIRTLDEAIVFVQKYVQVPVVLPELADATFVDVDVYFRIEGTGTANLSFNVGGVPLTIQYGDARFDGCGEANFELEVAGKPAIALLADHGNHLLWPKTAASGTDYGLYGDFDIDTLVEWAEQMEAARRALGKKHSSGC